MAQGCRSCECTDAMYVVVAGDRRSAWRTSPPASPVLDSLANVDGAEEGAVGRPEVAGVGAGVGRALVEADGADRAVDVELKRDAGLERGSGPSSRGRSGTAELSQSVAGTLPSGAVVLKVHDTGAAIGEPAASFAVVTVAVYVVDGGERRSTG